MKLQDVIYTCIRLLVKGAAVGFILLTGLLIFIKSLDYYTPDFNKGYLAGKQELFYGIFALGLYAHIVAAPIILFIGTYQVWLRRAGTFMEQHVLLGKVYTFLVLYLAAPGGLVLSCFAMGGWAGKMSFLLLSALWFVFTWKGAGHGDNKAVLQHRQYMIRSYVLAVSAVLLRLWLFIGIHFFKLYSDTAYAWMSWLSWLPAWLLTELLLKGQRTRRAYKKLSE